MKKSSISVLKKIAESLGYKTRYLSVPKKPKRLLITNGKKMYIANSTIYGFYPEVYRWQAYLFDSKILSQQVLKSLNYKTISTIIIRHKEYQTFSSLNRDILKKKLLILLSANQKTVLGATILD